MSSQMRYDFWDILKAPRIALSGKNLLVQTRALVYGYIAYLVLTYVALLIDGVNLDYIWSSFSLFPISKLGLFHWFAKALWFMAIILGASFTYYGTLTVAKLAFEELKGNYFYSAKTAAKEARTYLRVFWVAVILLAVLIVIFALLELVVGLIALIPAVGEIIYAVIYVFPLIIWSLFVVFLAFGLSTAFLTLPSIVVAKEKDAFGATFHIFNIIWTQPLRWAGFTFVSLVIAKVGTFVLSYFLMRALQLSNLVTSWVGSDKVKGILTAVYGMLAEQGRVIWFFTSLYPGSRIRFSWIEPQSFYQAAGTEYLASLIIFIGLIGLWLWIVAYGLNVITCGQLITFLLIRYREDNEKLTEELKVTEIDPRDILAQKTNQAPESE